MCSEPPHAVDAGGDSDPQTLIHARAVTKAYRVYSRPEDRLLELLSLGRARRHGLHWALRGVDLDVRRGDAVAILGRNGAGKTTLLKVICGLVEPTSGSVRLKGRIAPLIGLGTGIDPSLSGGDNLRLCAALWGLTSEQIEQRLPAIAGFSELGDFLDQPVRTYSTGMRARLAFSVAAHVDADVLIVDETLAVGDAAFVQKCMRWVRSFLQHGTLLLVSHATNLVLDLCSTAVWLDEGAVRTAGAARDVCLEYGAHMHALATGSMRVRVRNPARPEGVAEPAAGLPAQPANARNAPSDTDIRAPRLANAGRAGATAIGAFDPNCAAWGEMRLLVEHAGLRSPDGSPASFLTGGEPVELLVRAHAIEPIASPVFGFTVHNARGLHIFGDNTFVLPDQPPPPPMNAGDRITASFRFRWPYLRSGRYCIAVATADGIPGAFTQQHWLDAAILLDVHPSHVVYTQIAVPLLGCSLHLEPPADRAATEPPAACPARTTP